MARYEDARVGVGVNLAGPVPLAVGRSFDDECVGGGGEVPPRP